MRALILFAALLMLSPARANVPFNAELGEVAFSDSDLIPAWPESDRKREWPDGPVKDFLRDLQRPDNDRHPERDKHALLLRCRGYGRDQIQGRARRRQAP